MNASLHSPPRPLLLSETPFSQRKRTPFRAPQPPKAPAKSCPPVSRVFHTPLFANTGPRFVSFKSERKSDGKGIVLVCGHPPPPPPPPPPCVATAVLFSTLLVSKGCGDKAVHTCMISMKTRDLAHVHRGLLPALWCAYQS